MWVAKSIRTENACVSEGRRENAVRWSRTAFFSFGIVFSPTLEKRFLFKQCPCMGCLWTQRQQFMAQAFRGPRRQHGKPTHPLLYLVQPKYPHTVFHCPLIFVAPVWLRDVVIYRGKIIANLLLTSSIHHCTFYICGFLTIGPGKV